MLKWKTMLNCIDEVRSGANIFGWIVMAVALIACTGCYPDWPEHAGTAVVHGNISIDGSPVTEAKVIFIPVNLSSSGEKVMQFAYGMTNSKGDFELSYSDGTKELIAGMYTVMISKSDFSDDDGTLGGNPWQSDLVPDSVKNLVPFSEHGEHIPSIYNQNSALQYEIVASPAIVRPKFELTAVDPALSDLEMDDLPLIDLPILK